MDLLKPSDFPASKVDDQEVSALGEGEIEDLLTMYHKSGDIQPGLYKVGDRHVVLDAVGGTNTLTFTWFHTVEVMDGSYINPITEEDHTEALNAVNINEYGPLEDQE